MFSPNEIASALYATAQAWEPVFVAGLAFGMASKFVAGYVRPFLGGK